MAGRINARIDQELALKLAEISKITGQSTTAIIKAALDAYVERLRATSASPKQALKGFIGCAAGEPDLSTRYKAVLSESLSRKA